jgi:hypothetical protein
MVMPGILHFHQLFRSVSARQIEYSFSDLKDVVTTMIPLTSDLLPSVESLAQTIPFAGEWAWSVKRFWTAINPDAFLFRLDWCRAEPVAMTLYCRFPVEPGEAEFDEALVHAKPFRWNGPAIGPVAAALGTAGPRGIAFRVSKHGTLRSALYFRSDLHAGIGWTQRLFALVDACGYPAELSATVESHLAQLYQPGPVGIVGIDDGGDGTAGTLKFDPGNVPLDAAYSYLSRIGVPASRIAEFSGFSTGLRAKAATYVGVQFRQQGLSGWRLYFACEPSHVRLPAQVIIAAQRNLRPVRRLPHY